MNIAIIESEKMKQLLVNSLALATLATALALPANGQVTYLNPEAGTIYPNGTAGNPWNFLESALEVGKNGTVQITGGKTIYGERRISEPVTLTASGGAVTIGTPLSAERMKNPQYGFAHRANEKGVISEVLIPEDGQGSAIEIDIGFSTFYNAWIVEHDLFQTAVASDYLWEWLAELRTQLDTGLYNQSFAALWLDIKTPNAADLSTVVDLVRLNVPSSVAVMYDLQGPENYGVDSAGTTQGYDRLKQIGLLPNEGLSCWFNIHANGSGKIQKLWDIFKRDKIVRSVVHHGHAGNIDHDVLIELNTATYHQKSDPYRFKKVFSWTIDLSSGMDYYVNPANPWHTDGLIVGDPIGGWSGYFGDILDFDNSINRYANTQRKAVRSVADFWYRSGSTVP